MVTSCRVPHKGEVQPRALKYDEHGDDAEHQQLRFPGLSAENVVEVALAVIVIAENGGKGEEQRHHRDEPVAGRAEGGPQRRLHVGHALQLRRGRHAGAQAQKRRGGADDKGDQEHGEHLCQPLLDRVGH